MEIIKLIKKFINKASFLKNNNTFFKILFLVANKKNKQVYSNYLIINIIMYHLFTKNTEVFINFNKKYNLLLDTIYYSFILQKFVSSFITHGNKAYIEKIFYNFYIDIKIKYRLFFTYLLITFLFKMKVILFGKFVFNMNQVKKVKKSEKYARFQVVPTIYNKTKMFLIPMRWLIKEIKLTNLYKAYSLKLVLLVYFSKFINGSYLQTPLFKYRYLVFVLLSLIGRNLHFRWKLLN